ncbi:hypothetical protein [Nocardioides humilatus]|uniref:hypothetical protein n=1 Tax=Nocardioides humilatus TaxID=2607660 RepID=UPI00165F6AEF|nr:hypothetical protein [Nocardioides humilatus]
MTVEAVTVRRVATVGADVGLRRWRRATVLAAVLALLAGTALMWATARPEPDGAAATIATARDQALIDGSAAVETLHTLDHRDVADGLDSWAAVTAGELHDQVAAIDRKRAAALADVGAVSTARVVEAAIVDLDTDAGTAELIAFVEVTVVPRSGPDTVERSPYSVALRRDGGHWKVTALTPMEIEQ